jgi:hypothetical protein
VSELPLSIGRALVSHQEQRRIGVPQVMGGSDPKPRRLANLFNQILDLALAKRSAAFFSRIDKKKVNPP